MGATTMGRLRHCQESRFWSTIRKTQYATAQIMPADTDIQIPPYCFPLRGSYSLRTFAKSWGVCSGVVCMMQWTPVSMTCLKTATSLSYAYKFAS